MKKILAILFVSCFAISAYAQETGTKVSSSSVIVRSSVEFYVYDGPYGDQENIKEPAVKFILTVKNAGNQPIPDLAVSNRSEYVNFFVNDSNANPISMYNGIEANGEHLIQPNGTDSYTWWVFEKDAYAKVFTVQWQYMGLYSNKLKVDMTKKTVVSAE